MNTHKHTGTQARGNIYVDTQTHRHTLVNNADTGLRGNQYTHTQTKPSQSKVVTLITLLRGNIYSHKKTQRNSRLTFVVLDML